MKTQPQSLAHHRVSASDPVDVCQGIVKWSPRKSIWFFGMLSAAVVGGAMTFSWGALVLFLATTGCVLLLGHSLGSHRKLIHDSYACPRWLEYLLVYFGVQVGLAGPIGLLRQHELRDFAQRMPDCHDYLRHGRGFWRDAWWQLACELELAHPPVIRIEQRVAADRFYQFLERTWMAQQLPWAILFFLWGGWGFVFWGVCARVAAGVLGHWLIGYFAHNQGQMHYQVDGAAVQGRNILFTSLLTMGESWHNNHHAFPGSARLGLFAGEWDPGWWMLRLLQRVGLVWNFRLPAQMAHREELQAVDQAGGALLVTQGKTQKGPDRQGWYQTWIEARAALGRGAVGRSSLKVQWPGATIPESVLRGLIGRNVKIDTDPASRRLTLLVGSRRINGLPALCIANGYRNLVARAAAHVMLPVAVLYERARSV